MSGGFEGKHAPVPKDGGGGSLAVDAFLHRNRAPPSGPYGVEAQDEDQDEGARQRGPRRPLPHGIFHAHAHDMAYLEEWIGEILNISRDTDGGKGDEDGVRGGRPR